jgi:hypothetical protein
MAEASGDCEFEPSRCTVIASEAKQSMFPIAEAWIASSLRFSQ